MAEEKTFKERFDNLSENFNNFKNEESNLEEAGIKELNTKIGILVELDNNVRELAKDIKSNPNDDDLVSDGEVLGNISNLLKSLEETSSELRDAQRGREKLRNKIIDEKHVLEGQRDEFEKYIDALNEERVPVDELYNKYNEEIELLLEGGKPNYKLEDGVLVESATIPEIKEEDVITEDTVMEEEPEHVEELVAEPVIEETKEAEESLEQIRDEVASELAQANEEVQDEETTETEENVFNPFGEYLTDTEEPVVGESEEPIQEPVIDETPAVETEKEEVVDNPLFDDSFTYEPTSEESNPVIDETPVVEETPAVSETIEETSQEPVMDETPVVEEPVMEGTTEDLPKEVDMLTALKNFREELGSFDDDKLEVVAAKEASMDLYKQVTPELLEGATQYMNKYNKELNAQEKTKAVEPQYELREGEVLSASVTDKNGVEKTVEIDTNGNKTVMDEDGNVLNTEHVELDENALKNGENIKIVDTRDISLSTEEPQDLVPHMPDFSSLEEGITRKRVA